jgi:hypothetical protein
MNRLGRIGISRLSWVVAGMIAFSCILTLAGQPASYLHNPATAIRGDGLSVFSTTNPTFSFWISHGWLPFVVSSILFIALINRLIVILPRVVGQMAGWALVFGYTFNICNWLAVGWHLSFIGGVGACCFAVASLLVWATVTNAVVSSDSLRAFQWLLVLASTLDYACTLIGQPSSYWQNPATVHEGNPMARYFLLHGWGAYTFYMVIFYVMGPLGLTAWLPRPASFVVAIAFMFGGCLGASNWFFYEWRMGLETPVLIGCVFSFLVVRFCFREGSLDTAAGISAWRRLCFCR